MATKTPAAKKSTAKRTAASTPKAQDDDVIVIRPRAERRERQRTLKFDLGGKVYTFRTPKAYGLLDALREMTTNANSSDLPGEFAMYDELEEWLFQGFSEEDGQDLKRRLSDEDDDLDIEDLTALFGEITKRLTGRSPR